MIMPDFEEFRDFLQTVSLLRDGVDGEELIDEAPVLNMYRDHHTLRLWRSLQIIADHVPLDAPLKVLELGSAPYHFDAVLAKFTRFELIGSNVKAGIWPEKSELSEIQSVVLSAGQTEQELDFPIHIFNFELDTFPFENETFDLVLCMEVIEHLAYSPSHMLAEAHRVMKPEATLLLTTPNSLSMHKMLRMIRNRSIAFHYSGYGVYGRHNREFTSDELSSLSRSCGFDVRQVIMENIEPSPAGKNIAGFFYKMLLESSNLSLSWFKKKRDYIFLVGTRGKSCDQYYGDDFYYYPKMYEMNTNER